MDRVAVFDRSAGSWTTTPSFATQSAPFVHDSDRSRRGHKERRPVVEFASRRADDSDGEPLRKRRPGFRKSARPTSVGPVVISFAPFRGHQNRAQSRLFVTTTALAGAPGVED